MDFKEHTLDEITRTARSGICTRCGEKTLVQTIVSWLPPFNVFGKSVYLGREHHYDGFRCHTCDNPVGIAKNNSILFCGVGARGRIFRGKNIEKAS